MPFTGADLPNTAELTKWPWFHDGYAWATDGRILVRAAVTDLTPSELIDPAAMTPEIAEKRAQFNRNAIELLAKETDPGSDWTKAKFPPGGIPAAPIGCAGCFTCGRPWDTPRRPTLAQPVAIDGGRVFFEAHYLRLLEDLPIELDFFVREPRRAAFFTDGYAKFVGILMPLQPSADQALDAIRKQWGKGHE